jgi:hypothetical protein
MNDFAQVAQSLAVALKSLQMYTASHPRSIEAMATAQGVLERWLSRQEKLQFLTTASKAFVDGQPVESRNPHISILARLISERGVSGFSFERGIQLDEIQVFLQGLALKPAVLDEQGGFEMLLQSAGVLHIKVSKTKYQEVTEGEETGAGDKAPAFSPAPPPSPSPENLVKFIRSALLATITKGGGTSEEGTLPGTKGPGGGGPRSDTGTRGNELEGAPGGMYEDGGLGQLASFSAADLSGLGPLGRELGLGEGMPTPSQLGTLRQVLMGLSPEVQLNLLAGLASLPPHPAGLGLGVKALAGEILAVATSSILAQGATWTQLKEPLQDILRPIPDRDRLVRTLTSHLRITGQDASQAEAILRHLDWEALSLEARLLKVLEEGYLFELSLEQRLALLRELLDLRRFHEFLRIQEVLLETLRSPHSDLRLKAIQTVSGMARWAEQPGLPPGSEGAMAESLRAHFAWEPEPPIHQWATEAVESLLVALVHRGELRVIVSEIQELDGLCAFLEERHAWRYVALAKLRAAIQRPELLDLAIAWAFTLERDQMLREVQPYLEFTGEPMARQLVVRLGSESDRTRRGRLVEALRSLGPAAVPALLDALGAPAWFLVRNALTLLSDLGDAGCVPAVLPLLRHPEPRVRRTAVRALWKLGGPAVEPHLVARMKDADGETMQEILFALGQLRAESGLAPVADLAKDKRVHPKLRIQALDTLGQIGSPQSQPVLVECMRRKGFFGGGEAPAIRMAAAKALMALGTPDARAIVQKVAESEPKGEEREFLGRLLNPPVAP